MISSLSLNQSEKFSTKKFNWIEKVAFLKDNPVINFSEGINIIVGPNGSGKTTIADLCGFLTWIGIF